jgi:hypothetical protein
MIAWRSGKSETSPIGQDARMLPAAFDRQHIETKLLADLKALSHVFLTSLYAVSLEKRRLSRLTKYTLPSLPASVS